MQNGKNYKTNAHNLLSLVLSIYIEIKNKQKKMIEKRAKGQQSKLNKMNIH